VDLDHGDTRIRDDGVEGGCELSGAVAVADEEPEARGAFAVSGSKTRATAAELRF
jgi:hypothetical protein